MLDTPTHSTTDVAQRPARDRGFTLLEVMIALGILAASLAVLVGAQTRAVLLTNRAATTATVAQLARGQMFAVEAELMTDGFQVSQQTERGDFRDEGYPDLRWEAVIEPVEITDSAMNEFNSQVSGQLLGDGTAPEEGGTTGVLSGSNAVSQFMPMILSQIPIFINQLGVDRVRRIDLTVTWEDATGKQEFTVQQYVVLLEKPETTGIDTDQLLQGTPTGAGAITQ